MSSIEIFLYSLLGILSLIVVYFFLKEFYITAFTKGYEKGIKDTEYALERALLNSQINEYFKDSLTEPINKH